LLRACRVVGRRIEGNDFPAIWWCVAPGAGGSCARARRGRGLRRGSCVSVVIQDALRRVSFRFSERTGRMLCGLCVYDFVVHPIREIGWFGDSYGRNKFAGSVLCVSWFHFRTLHKKRQAC